MRAFTACLLALVLVVCGASNATAAVKKRPLTSCQKIAKRYKDRSPDRKLVLVEKGDDETGSIQGCVLPRGKIRKLASWDDGLSRDSAAILTTIGTWVLVQDDHGDQYGGTSRVLTRVDVRSGRRTTLAGYGCQLDYTLQHCPSGTSYGEIVITAIGAGAIELSDFATNTTALFAFTATGVLEKLADGAVDGLRIVGTQIVWTQGGAQFSAPLRP